MTLRLTDNAGGAFLPNGDMWVAHHISGRYHGYMVLVRVFGFRDIGDERRNIIVNQFFERCPTTRYGQQVLNADRPVRETPMKVILINPSELPKVVEIDGSGDYLRELVGGYLEALPFTDTTSAYVDEEAKVRTDKHVPTNALATALMNKIGPGLWPGDHIAGPMIIVGNLDEHGEYDGEEHDVPQNVIDQVMNFRLEI